MERLITGPLAEALKQGRDRFNTKFAIARRSYPSLEADAFADHLRGAVEPIINAVYKVRPDKTDDVVDALYDISLDLMSKGLIGERSRYPAIIKSWNELFVTLPNLLAHDARLFAGAVSNAVYNLSTATGARPTFWIDSMKQIGTLCPNPQIFLDAGKVLAWRSGMAHYRASALDACLNLGAEIARKALWIADSALPVEAVVERLKNDPWLAPGGVKEGGGWKKSLKQVGYAGAFRGFGGTFVSPPEVSLSEGEFILFDNENCWMLTADVFGATLHRMGTDLPKVDSKTKSNLVIDKKGRASKEQYQAVFPHLADATSWASNATTLAVTIPLSHSVYLIALTDV
jgi:hypothetical protein